MTPARMMGRPCPVAHSNICSYTGDVSCDGRVDNHGRCTNPDCEAWDLARAYRHTAAQDRPGRWQALLAAHDGRFLGQCPGTAQVHPTQPCDREERCAAHDERAAMLAWQVAGRPGSPLVWQVFQAAHGGRLHHTKQTSMAARTAIGRSSPKR